ncbi:hypothetical protein AB0B28_08305 [Glycomyces sp. NPDC046736]|uniref:hypothetical protein n=1 Tax=Glycomyces sp. NPDC046736 TaxID=3155615 RepID=UPI0033E2BBF9
MIAHRTLAVVALTLRAARAALSRPELPGLDEPTREYDPVDLDDLGPRAPRQIHGLTASELAAEDRSQRHHLRRIEMELIGDADFRTLAASLLDQLPDS